MPDELFINVVLEGKTKFKMEPGTVMPDSTGEGREVEVHTTVSIEAGLSSWKDDPYRARVYTDFRGADVDDQTDERRFQTDEQLFQWLDGTLTELRTKGFTQVRHKLNGMSIDWLNRINLPDDDPT